MNLLIFPGNLSGAVTPPPSKSMAHRLLIAAALASGVSVIRNVALSQDMEATLRCMESLGAQWEQRSDGAICMHGIGGARRAFAELPHFDCGESGSTLRFLIPIALAVAGGGVFTGRGRLMERPQQPYFDIFDKKGIFYEQKDGVLTVRGTLTAGEYRLAGNVSSQFFTGLLFALSLLDDESSVISTTELESADYVTMTREAMARAGVLVETPVRLLPASRGGLPLGGLCFKIVPASYRPFEATVEADWSQSGFWYAAQGIGNAVTVEGMDERSAQGDRVMLDYAAMLRGEPLRSGAAMPTFGPAEAVAFAPLPDRSAWRTPCVGSVSLDISGCPDLAPPLAAWGALLNGTLVLKNAARLRLKESDRLTTITAALIELGAEVYEEYDRLTVVGLPELRGGVVNSANDHRIAMMAAIAATRCVNPVTILGAECVRKSYPDFWEVYQSLGGEIRVI